MRAILPLTIALLFAPAVAAQRLVVREVMHVGTADHEDDRYLFGSIRGLAVGRDGSLFVADEPSMEVREFDPSGHAVSVRGSRGQGPGELLSISALAVNDEGRLVVMDNRSLRVTRFRPDTRVESARWEGNSVPRKIAYLDGVGYVCLLSLGFPRGTSPPIFRVLDENLDEIGRFGDFAAIGLMDDRFGETLLEFNPGYFDVDEAGGIVYTPFAYQGKSFRFRRTNGASWNLAGVHEGAVGGRAYTLADARRPPRDASIIYWGADILAAVFRNQSLGVHVMPDGETWVFSLSEIDGKRQLVVEQFAPSGEFRRILPVELEVPIATGPQTAISFPAFDGRFFYLIDFSKGYQTVRKVSLELRR